MMADASATKLKPPTIENVKLKEYFEVKPEKAVSEIGLPSAVICFKGMKQKRMKTIAQMAKKTVCIRCIIV